jgi:hypothetical protein
VARLAELDAESQGRCVRIERALLAIVADLESAGIPCLVLRARPSAALGARVDSVRARGGSRTHTAFRPGRFKRPVYSQFHHPGLQASG